MAITYGSINCDHVVPRRHNALNSDSMMEVRVPVLIVGGGPAGLIAALQLAKHGVNCMIAERNLDTTPYPKMTLHNCRTMELMKRLGLDEGLRTVGVDEKYNFRSIFHSGLSEGGHHLGSWDMESPASWKEKIRTQNDGTQPRIPYQRCAQSVFEKWLKPIVSNEPLVDARFGFKLESVKEEKDGVVSELQTHSGDKYVVRSDYVLGCDGGGSRVRRALGIRLAGGPAPRMMYLINFKSRDLTRLRKLGQSWHIFFAGGGLLTSQNEMDIWTVHCALPMGTDTTKLDPYQLVYDTLGASTGVPYHVEIDEILLTSVWRPGIALAEHYRSQGGRIFLSGDSAHQHIPTGGYGYNTAVGDSIDIGWKLAAFIQGWGGSYLLDSYEIERRPVGATNLKWAGIHAKTHLVYNQMSADKKKLNQLDKEGESYRQSIMDHVHRENIENKCYGVEMGYRYNDSPIINSDANSVEPVWTGTDYIADTWPGARAPHVWLKDGKTSIFDLYGNDFTLVDFTFDGRFIHAFAPVAQRLKVPIEQLHLPDEAHVRSIWARDAVLIRPDDMVAWRASVDGNTPADIERILLISIGKIPALSIGDADAKQREKTSFVEDVGFHTVDKSQSAETIMLEANYVKQP